MGNINENSKILIIDDRAESIELLTNTLRKESFDVSFALSGKEALEMVETYDYDLILLDIKMPEMDGFEVCKRLQEKEKTRDIPVLFLSQYGDTDNIVKGLKMGGRDYIEKNAVAEELLARIDTHLRIRKIEIELLEKNAELDKKNTELESKNAELNIEKQKLKRLNSELKQINEELQKEKETINQLLLGNLDEKDRIKKILNNILPSEITEELMRNRQVRPYHYTKVSVLFADIIDFSTLSKDMIPEPEQLISRLDEYFSAFDRIVKRWRIEKIKTIGDAYMAAGGIFKRNNSNPIQAVLAGLEIQQFIKDKNDEDKSKDKKPWQMRLGIHTGDVIAGILGKSKYSYDIWGDTVNIASRLQSKGEAGKVNISEKTYEEIKDFFVCTQRGDIDTKHIGKMRMYFVERIKKEYSNDDEGMEPNGELKKIIDELYYSKDII